jgi:cytochrome c peroxidase
VLSHSELAVVAGSVAIGLGSVLVAFSGSAVSQRIGDESLRRSFARPAGIPYPIGSPPSSAVVELGERLFADTRLSANGKISCSTCHDPKLGLADGAPRSTAGATGRPLRRHTPSLWNVAFVPKLMWDGRAASLEEQAVLPISDPDEMASSPQSAAAQLADDASMRTAFAEAFPERPAVDAVNLLSALAAYQRTLVSPPTRFDSWVRGESGALTAQERAGLSIFAGKAHCISCHIGFSFTDHAFHDIGLPTTDGGRGPIAGIKAAEHAFKTPTLRELAWTAPYMHDGSIPTLEDVVRHYESGGIDRPSRSREMPKAFTLTDEERAALVAFLETLSSDAPPRPSDEPWVRRDAPRSEIAFSIGATTISQKNRTFTPAAIRVRHGQSITVLNDDTRTHNVRIASPQLEFNSGAQEPGESVVLRLDRTGTFEAHCGIHPTMRLTIVVGESE